MDGAAVSKLFHAGWRPLAGWLGVMVIMYHTLILPLAQWLVFKSGHDLTGAPHPMDANSLWPVVSGLFGIAALRSFDKSKGTAKE